MSMAGLNPSGPADFANKLITRMTGNANFPDPQPALADLTAKKDELRALRTAAEDGTRQDRFNRNVAADELKGMIRVLASYVSMVAAGDGSIILSSGFSVRDEAEPLPPVTVPQALTATATAHRGVVEPDWERVEHALNYQVLMSTDASAPLSEWAPVALTSKSKAEISNLVRGQAYFFRVQAVGRTNKSGFSNPAEVMAA
jgi:predicted phage tail protein